MVQTTYELADMIGAMTTSVASNKQAASTPVEFLTCPLVAEMIEDLSNFRFGGLGEGLSIWQCLPYEGEWKSALYYSSTTDLNAFNSSGKAKRTSKAELLKLRQYLTIERFDAMVENYALLRSEYGSSAAGVEIREAGRMAKLFYLSRGNYDGERERTAALERFVDIIDEEAKRQMEIVEEMVRLSRMHDRTSTMRLLKTRFEEVDWDVVGLEKIPPLKIRHLCHSHVQSLDVKSWPRKEHHCNCEWTVRVEMQLDAAEVSKTRLPSKYGVSMFSVAKPVAVPDTSDEELCKNRGGDTAEDGGGAAETGGAVGGNKFEAIKNNGEDKYPFARRSGVWRNHMYVKVKVEFNSLLIAKGIDNPADYCIKALSACAILKGHKKCQSGTCKRKHKIPEDVLAEITSLDFVFRKTLLLYYKCLWGGTKCEPNGDISKDKLGVICKALLAEIKEEGEETEDEDPAPGSAPVGGKGMPVSPEKDSAATTKPKIGGVTIPKPGKLPPNLKKPKSGGGVADSNRVYFDALEPPQLLPDGLISIASSVTEIPFETLGVLPVQHIFDINVTYAANVPGCGVFF